MEEKEIKNFNDIEIIVEPLYYRAIKKSIKLSSKFQNVVKIKELKEFLQLKPSNKELKKIKNKIQDIEKNIFKPLSINSNNNRKNIFKFFDETNITYSPIELDQVGLSSSVSGSLIYTFLQYDFKQKYGSEEVLKNLFIDTNGLSEKEIEFRIEKAILLLDRIKDENWQYFLNSFFIKVTNYLDLILDDEEISKENLENLLEYLKMMIKLLKTHFSEVKNKEIHLKHFKNNIIGRKYGKIKYINELKSESNLYLRFIEERKKFLSEAISEFKDLKNNFSEKIKDKSLIRIALKKLKKLIPKPKGEVGVRINDNSIESYYKLKN